jgi:DNA ligase-1
MLAESVQNVDEALKAHNGASSFEYKPDGARVQIHKHYEHVQVFSRRLTNVTESLPDIVDLVKRNLHANEAIVEGEAIAVDANGKPKPFQHLMRRFRRIKEIEQTLKEVPIQLQLFDIMYLDGQQLIDLPYSERRRKLAEICGKILLTKQIFTSNNRVAQEFFEGALASGYEGLIAKEPNSLYTPGVRGKKWLKLKRVPDTLDLVVVAADYGYGYRHAWLSDYYLAARNLETNEYEVVGKCFTGLTDDEIRWMTQQLNEIKLSQQGRTITVAPKIVLEIAFTEIQRSPTYRSGYTLRFARIVRIRDDKAPQDADTVQRIAEMFVRQFKIKSS